MIARTTLTVLFGFLLLSCGGNKEQPSEEAAPSETVRAPSAAPASAEAPAPAAPEIVRADLPGRTIFEHQCAPCHGAGPGDDGMPMLPGTMTLAQKYEGALPAQLELRSDLNAGAIALFVRRGSGAMPSFRKSELSDADIDALAAYFAATSKASGYGELD